MDKSSSRRLSAILATDVVGYSRMMGEDEARTLRALRALRDETLSPFVDAQQGRIVKGTGDGWLVAFDSAAAAVQCAVSVQDSLTEDAPLPGRAAFRLYDTYGFPLDLTQDALREKGRAVDTDGFDEAMAEQKAKARAAWAGTGEAADASIWFDIAEGKGTTDFLEELRLGLEVGALQRKNLLELVKDQNLESGCADCT